MAQSINASSWPFELCLSSTTAMWANFRDRFEQANAKRDGSVGGSGRTRRSPGQKGCRLVCCPGCFMSVINELLMTPLGHLLMNHCINWLTWGLLALAFGSYESRYGFG